MSDLSGCAKCVKYTLFLFNLLFLLAGLALIIIGAVAQVQANKISGFGSSASGVAILFIVIGSLIFVICFFGCAGAINNNYCMVVTFGVLLLLLLLAQIGAIVAGFVLKEQVKTKVIEEMQNTQKTYTGDEQDISTQTWDHLQQALQCCGTNNTDSWRVCEILDKDKSLPDSCCINDTAGCGFGARIFQPLPADKFYTLGCNDKVTTLLKSTLVIVGAAAAVVAALELIGIVFAFCLAHSLRKDYRVV